MKILNYIAAFFICLLLPWIWLFDFIFFGGGMFRGNSGHGAGLAAGFLQIGALVGALIQIVALILGVCLYAIIKILC